MDQQTPFYRDVRTVYRALAVAFWTIGCIAFLNTVLTWRLYNVIPWASVMYGTMDVFVGYGFWNMQRWMLVAFLIHASAITAIVAIKMLGVTGYHLTSRMILTLILSWSITLILLYTKRALGGSKTETLVGIGIFMLLWLTLILPTMVIIRGT